MDEKRVIGHWPRPDWISKLVNMLWTNYYLFYQNCQIKPWVIFCNWEKSYWALAAWLDFKVSEYMLPTKLSIIRESFFTSLHQSFLCGNSNFFTLVMLSSELVFMKRVLHSFFITLKIMPNSETSFDEMFVCWLYFIHLIENDDNLWK